MGAAATFATILARHGVAFSAGGEDYMGIRTHVRNVRDVLPQGRRDAYRFSLVVPVATGEAIANSALVTVLGTAHRVASRTVDGPGITCTLHLIED